MTIDEAIKELEEPDWLVTENHTPEYAEAVQLGIEALKREKMLRDPGVPATYDMLPGETSE